ncbi:unnamed protein product [Orchesella dallaii]|uniref:Uncharacterized protein n=1 Tax=Orchesella dallaii TaxID=48710 RepID=A0ABP1S1C4_9HEXA
MPNCASFWKKSSRSIQVAEQVKAEIGCCVITPVKTRWNSTYDSMKQLAEHIEKLDIIFDKADKTILLMSLEKEFLIAYKEVVGPVAWALDKLQGENNMFLSYLAPIIHQAKSKLDSFSASESAFLSHLAAALITGFQQRYSKILNLDLKEAFNEIMSAISLPQFKLWWIGDPESKERCKAAFITEAKKYESCAAAQSCTDACEADACNDDDLFDFQKELAKTPTTQENAEL